MKCYHMSGAGNDFMVLDGRELTGDLSQMAKKLCAITGADGFMAAGISNRADVRMNFYNSDGSRGEMCGNGARCLCRFAYDMGLVTKPEMTLEADAGIVYGTRLEENLYRVKLNLPTVLEPNRVPGVAYVELGSPGIPHAVTMVPNLTFQMADELRTYAKELRHHPMFPKGANVNFYCPLDGNTVRILTFERGVEDYTLGCGTGCGSTAAVLFAAGRLPGKHLNLENKGGVLQVTLDGTPENITMVALEGDATVLGEYEVE